MTRSLLATIPRALGLLALVLMQSAWFAQPIPFGFKLAQVALVALAVSRPAYACYALASLGPLTVVTRTLLPPPFSGAQILEQMVLAVVTGVVARLPSDTAASRTNAAAAIVAMVALTSAAAVLPAALFAAAPDLSVWRQAVNLWRGDYFAPDPARAPLVFAMLAIESMALFWSVATFVRRDRAVAVRLIALALAGNGAAATLNICALGTGALRSGNPLSVLPSWLLTHRVILQADFNSAASVFVLILLAGGSLLKKPWGRGLAVALILLVTFVALWLTGSRIALGSVVVVLVVRTLWGSLRPGKVGWWIILAAAASVVVAASLYAFFYPAGRNDPAWLSLTSRFVLFKIALRMAASAPLFGIGIGTFWQQSSSFGGGELVTRYGWLYGNGNENAHNNFLQVLAEQGTVGLVALLVLLGLLLLPTFTRARLADRTQSWLAAGITGFVMTWLTGHPLLVPEAALVFWLFAGILAGLTSTPAALRRPAPWVWLSIALLVSVPVRVLQNMNTADFSHVGLGLSPWQHDPDRTIYRIAGATFSLYVPASSFVEVPVRRAPGAPDTVRVELRVDGQLVNSTLLTGSSWRALTLRLPSRHRRFIRVDFAVTAEAAHPLPASCLHVGQDKAQ